MVQAGRSKAFRPLPAAARAEAMARALEAFERGDWFEAHELLEPAWMGSDDLTERALHQGLIKLAAAGVHGVRGNPAGMARNLVGARAHLARAADAIAAQRGGDDAEPAPAALGELGPVADLDLAALVAQVDAAIAAVAALPPGPERVPGSPRFASRTAVPVELPRPVRRR